MASYAEAKQHKVRKVVEENISATIASIVKDHFMNEVCRNCPGYLDCSLIGFPTVSYYGDLRRKSFSGMCSINNSRTIVKTK